MAAKPLVVTGLRHTEGLFHSCVEDGKNGFLVDEGDVETTRRRLTRLMTDSALREKMGRRSREIARKRVDVDEFVLDCFARISRELESGLT
jgi:glycosyltransferase involved in cell wall biosynthesis